MDARPTVLLVGNGPNQVGGNPSWTALLNGVAMTVRGTPLIEADGLPKPFPILYERLLIEARRNREWDETRLKQEIAAQCEKIAGMAIHRRIIGLPVDEILTTNYDHALEEASIGSLGGLGSPFAAEQRYSLFRHIRMNDGRRLWYVHGDSRSPASILLGYDQYSGYLQQMRLYATGTLHYAAGPVGPLFKNKKRTSEAQSWVSRFFDADVWILGLGLEFVEIHLWWLLTHRARMRSRGITTGNTVRYLYRPGEVPSARLELLVALDVVPMPVGQGKPWPAYYELACNAIHAEL